MTEGRAEVLEAFEAVAQAVREVAKVEAQCQAMDEARAEVSKILREKRIARGQAQDALQQLIMAEAGQ